MVELVHSGGIFSAPVVSFLGSPYQQDENDWLVWMKECKPFIGVVGNKGTFTVGLLDRGRDLKGVVSW